MIAKELDPLVGTSPRELAGRRAEEQMAFYLKRRFVDHPDVWVFNGLRFEHNGIFTQIDHLLLTTVGFFVIESKSVTTRVRISPSGEWERQVTGDWKGMASPLLQGDAQLHELIAVLDAHAESLMSKLLGIQRRFGGFHQAVYVAISDSGVIERPTPESFPTVLKADQVCVAVAGAIRKLQENTGLKGLLKASFTFAPNASTIDFTPEDILRVRDWLVAQHRPAALPPSTPPSPVAAPPSASDKPSRYFCAHCGCGITYNIAKFCWNNKARFGGKAYCMDCQKQR